MVPTMLNQAKALVEDHRFIDKKGSAQSINGRIKHEAQEKSHALDVAHVEKQRLTTTE